jgi:phosphopantetheine--protein transferase-like protein
MTVGTDLVHIPSFIKSLDQMKHVGAEKIFTPSELKLHTSLESLAGAFAAKEAVVKAVSLTTLGLSDIEVLKHQSGKPYVVCDILESLCTVDLSISHDGEYAVAFAIAEWK